MANLALQQQASVPLNPGWYLWIHRILLGLAIATLFLMGLGSATRVMNAGLACPDWPLCYGQLVPLGEMDLQVFLEWFHRLVASSVGRGFALVGGDCCPSGLSTEFTGRVGSLPLGLAPMFRGIPTLFCHE